MENSLMTFPHMKLFVNRLKCLKMGVNEVYYCANEGLLVLIVVKSCKCLSFGLIKCCDLF